MLRDQEAGRRRRWRITSFINILINPGALSIVVVHRTPFKKSLDAAFYFSRGTGQHQSLKDKCDTVLALTLVIRRHRFFLRTFFSRFIILFKQRRFISDTPSSLLTPSMFRRLRFFVSRQNGGLREGCVLFGELILDIRRSKSFGKNPHVCCRSIAIDPYRFIARFSIPPSIVSQFLTFSEVSRTMKLIN